MWEHKSGKHNQVVDALSRKEVFVEYIRFQSLKLISMIESGCAANDSLYVKWMGQVQYGTMRRYWIEDDLLYFKEGESLYQIRAGCTKI